MANTASIILKYLVLGADKANASLDRASRGTRDLGEASRQSARQQENLGKASSSAGRQFAAQSSGLGGLVAAYAGAAANIFALQQAFAALNRAAQIENIIRGTRTLASTVGASGDEIIATLQDITRSQITAAEAASAANLAFASGFSGEQLTSITEVATRASLALGRNLTDSLQRLTRGAAKLEPELLDELGIFTRIEPAVQKYADSIGKAASQLTRFERQQAFINEVIDEGQRKFNDIDISSSNAQTSLERLATKLLELGTAVTQVLLTAITPLVDFFAEDISNAFILFGAISTLVLGKFAEVASAAFSRAGLSAKSWADSLVLSVSQGSQAFQQAERNLTRAAGVIDRTLRNLAGPRDLAKGVREFVKELKQGNVPLERLRQQQSEINRLLDETRRKLQANRQERERINEAIARGVASERQRNRLAALDRSDTAQNRNVRSLDLLNRTVDARLNTVNRGASALGKVIGGVINFGQAVGRIGGTILTIASRVFILISVVQLLVNLFEQITGLDVGNLFLTLGEGILALKQEIDDTSKSIESFGFQAASVGREAIQELGINADATRVAIESLNSTIKEVIDTADDAVNSSINNLFGLFASGRGFRFETLEALREEIQSVRDDIDEAVNDRELERLPGLRALEIGLQSVLDQFSEFEDADFELVRALEDIARASGTTGSATTDLANRYLSISENGEDLISTFAGVERVIGRVTDNGQAEELNETVLRLTGAFDALTSGLVEGGIAASQVVERITTITSLANELQNVDSSTLTVAAQAEIQSLDREIQSVRDSIVATTETLNNLATQEERVGVTANPRVVAETQQRLLDLQEELSALLEDRPFIEQRINEQLAEQVRLNTEQAERVREILEPAQGFVDAFSSVEAIISSSTNQLGKFNDTLAKGLGVFFEDIQTVDLTNFTDQAAVGLNIEQAITTLTAERAELLENAERLAASGVEVNEERLNIEDKIANLQKIQVSLAFELLQAAIARRRELQETLLIQSQNIEINNLERIKREQENSLRILKESLKTNEQISEENRNQINFAIRLTELRQEAAEVELAALNQSLTFANQLLDIEQSRAELQLETTERQINAEFRLRELRLASRGQTLDSFENFGTRDDRRQNQLDLINLEEEKQRRLLDARIKFEEDRLARELQILENEKSIIENELAAKQSEIAREETLLALRNGLVAEQIRAAEEERNVQNEIIRKRIEILNTERDLSIRRARNEADAEIRALELEKAKAENDVKFINALTETNQNFLNELANILNQAVPGREITAGTLQGVGDESLNDIVGLLDQQIEGVRTLRDQEIQAISESTNARIDGLRAERTLIQRQITERIRELNREATINTEQSGIRREQLENEITALQGQLVVNQEQRDLAELSSAERIAALQAEGQSITDNSNLRRQALAEEADTLRQLADDISGVLKDKIGQGIQDLSKAYFDGTLTAENFKEGVRNLFTGILDGIRERVTERLIVQPVEDLIGSAFGGLFGTEADGSQASPYFVKFAESFGGFGDPFGEVQDDIKDTGTLLDKTIEDNKQQNVGFIESIFGSGGIFAQSLEGLGRVGRDTFAGLGNVLQSVFNSITGGSGSGISGFFGGIASGIGGLFGVGGANAAVSSASSAAGFFGTSTSALSSGLFIASGGLVRQMAAGGFVNQFAGGGPNMLRDRVPALLEPGEFVINKNSAQNIGLDNLRAMNRGGMNSGNVSVNIVNNGTAQETEGEPTVSFDGQQYVVDIILKDLRNNGPIRRGIRGNT